MKKLLILVLCSFALCAEASEDIERTSHLIFLSADLDKFLRSDKPFQSWNTHLEGSLLYGVQFAKAKTKYGTPSPLVGYETVRYAINWSGEFVNDHTFIVGINYEAPQVKIGENLAINTHLQLLGGRTFKKTLLNGIDRESQMDEISIRGLLSPTSNLAKIPIAPFISFQLNRSYIDPPEFRNDFVVDFGLVLKIK